MSALKVPLASLAEEGARIDQVVSAGDLQPHGIETPAFDEVHVEGRLIAVDAEYVFRGSISGTFIHPCDRCLAIARQPFRLEVDWFFEPGAALDGFEKFDEFDLAEDVDDEERVHCFEGNEIDLAVPVWEEVVLTTPTKFLCKENCAGLCPMCGTNLNESTCSCDESPREPSGALSKLADMFPDLKKQSTEE